MSDEKRKLFDYIADELYGLAEKYTGPKPSPESTAKAIESLVRGDKRVTSVEVSGAVGEDGGFTVTASTRDPSLIAEWANAGLLDDPAAHGLVQIGGTWMWPPLVLSSEGP